MYVSASLQANTYFPISPILWYNYSKRQPKIVKKFAFKTKKSKIQSDLENDFKANEEKSTQKVRSNLGNRKRKERIS